MAPEASAAALRPSPAPCAPSAGRERRELEARALGQESAKPAATSLRLIARSPVPPNIRSDLRTAPADRGRPSGCPLSRLGAPNAPGGG